MKKLDGGLKKKFFLIILFLIFSKNLLSSQIYDYQTEKFIDKIISEVISVNKYKKNIKFKIINNKFPNAYVNQDSSIYFTSGLLIDSPDYVSFLAVVAHEIGHLEKFHINKRKNEVDEIKNINSLGNIAAIAGSMIFKEPELLNSIIINQTALRNSYINFTQDQEREADLYSIKTLNKLKLPNESLKSFLSIIESKLSINILDDELKKFSSHPPTKERLKIINSNKNINNTGSNNYNNNLQDEFEYIQAKFIAYTNGSIRTTFDRDKMIYYKAIRSSLSGNLLESLKNLNYLIQYNEDKLFLLETKADILLSYGYDREAIKFYNKILTNQPENSYAQYNIFINSKFDDLSEKTLEKIFYKNLKLFNLFPNNRVLLTKFYSLSKSLKYDEWNFFLELKLFNKKDLEKKLNKLYNNTNDYNLKKIIYVYI